MKCSHCGNEAITGYDLCYDCFMEYSNEVKNGMGRIEE